MVGKRNISSLVKTIIVFQLKQGRSSQDVGLEFGLSFSQVCQIYKRWKNKIVFLVMQALKNY